MVLNTCKCFSTATHYISSSSKVRGCALENRERERDRDREREREKERKKERDRERVSGSDKMR